MKFFLITLLLAAVSAAPIDDDSYGEPVEVIVNGLEENEPLEVEEIVSVHLHEHENGELIAKHDLLEPFTAQGLADAAAAAAAIAEAESAAEQANLEVVETPDSIALPDPAQPEVVVPQPEGISLPGAPDPEVVENPDSSVSVPEGIVLPNPAQPEVVETPESIVLPGPATPEVVVPVPEGVSLPGSPQPEVVESAPESPEVAESSPEVPVAPASTNPLGEIYNDGLVSLTVNAPNDIGMLSTLSSWFSLVINFIRDGISTTSQLI